MEITMKNVIIEISEPITYHDSKDQQDGINPLQWLFCLLHDQGEF